VSPVTPQFAVLLPGPGEREAGPARVKYLGSGDVHIADALHHRLPITLASLKSKDMRRNANG